jgi:ribonucleoside-triphosphate reductase
LDKTTLGDIRCANEAEYIEGAEPYYTNSAQLPVNYTDDPFELLDLQDELQTKFTGGTVVHLFLGERIEDKNAVKQFVKTICQTYKLPYFSITPTFSVCPTHGYLEGEQSLCPACESPTEVYSRVVGYLRPINQWNKGKRAEYKNRRQMCMT